MALGLGNNTEKGKYYPLNASSISQGFSVPEVDDKLIDSSKFKTESKLALGSRLARTFLQDDATSTDSGDDDTSSTNCISTSLTSEDGEASDEDTTTFDHSCGDNAVVSCVYSVLFLLQARAAFCRVCPGSPRRSALGYMTELVPPPQQSASSYAYLPASHKADMAQRQSSLAVPSSAAVFTREPFPAVNCEQGDEQVIRSIRAILNKLTLEKFENLFGQLVSCGISAPHHVSTLMREVFEKATTQHQFIPMYAELCVRLEKDSSIMSAVKEAGSFRRLLLDQCQNSFEHMLQPTEPETVDEEEERQMRRKQQALGNVKLVGELLVRSMLGSSLLVACGGQLLESRTKCPVALECLAALLMVAGPQFDNQGWQHYAGLDSIFAAMKTLTKDKQLPARARFLLRDVLDARSAKWCTSANRAACRVVPMKLDDIRGSSEKQAVASRTRTSSFVQEATAASATRMRRSVTGERASVPLRIKPMPESMTHSARESTGIRRQVLCAASCADPGPEKLVKIVTPQASFDLVSFRRILATTLSKLASDRNIPAAVQYIRLQQLPIELQADQFVDIISRVVEERRGIVRRCGFAFAAGLIAAEADSPFDRRVCLAGIQSFFEDVYLGMCREVPRLPAILKTEFLPTMVGLYSSTDLSQIVPEELR